MLEETIIHRNALHRNATQLKLRSQVKAKNYNLLKIHESAHFLNEVKAISQFDSHDTATSQRPQEVAMPYVLQYELVRGLPRKNLAP